MSMESDSADLARDAGNHSTAAELYKMALAVEPNRADLWCQLGNMLKDSQQPLEAVEAYDTAIALQPSNSDIFLQRARALRQAGLTSEALESLKDGLKISPGNFALLQDLVELGSPSGLLGPHETLNLASIAGLVGSLQVSVEALVRRLPDLKQFVAYPFEAYSEYSPPLEAPNFLKDATSRDEWLLVAFPKTLSTEASWRLMISSAANSGISSIALPSGQEVLRQAADRVSTLPVASMRGSFRDWLMLPGTPENLILTLGPCFFKPDAISRIEGNWPTHVDTLVFDEDAIELESNGYPQVKRISPWLKPGFDPVLLEGGWFPATLVAVRRQALLAAICDSLDWDMCADELPPEVWLSWFIALALRNNVLHLPEVVASAFAPPAEPLPPRVMPLARPESALQMIDVIIPTRDRLDLLVETVASFRALAYDPSHLAIRIVDNGSQETKTLRWLEQERAAGRIAVTRLDIPFNWSRLNNIAARECKANYIVFANNDLIMKADGWDVIVRDNLIDSRVGVVGARLLAKNGSTCHAGIVVGTKHGCDHAGPSSPDRPDGPNGLFAARRQVAGVTGALMATRRTTFASLGGFDEARFPIWFSDLDYCLKARASELLVIYDPAWQAFHEESATLSVVLRNADRDGAYNDALNQMRMHWGPLMENDPFYNRRFSRYHPPFSAIVK